MTNFVVYCIVAFVYYVTRYFSTPVTSSPGQPKVNKVKIYLPF